MTSKTYTAVILAAGSGKRMGLNYNKVLLPIEGQPLIWHTLQPFKKDEQCVEIILVVASSEYDQFKEMFDDVTIVIGGETRQKSAQMGLQEVKTPYVMIHDGARCFVKLAQIQALMTCMETYDAALLMVPCVDTIKVVKNQEVVETLDRQILYQAQTPQCFKTDVIKKAHDLAHTLTMEIYDDAMLVEQLCQMPIAVVTSDYTNKKMTTKADM